MKKVYLIVGVLIVMMVGGCTQTTPPPSRLQSVEYGTNGSFKITEPAKEDLRYPAKTIKLTGSSNLPQETEYGFAFDPSSNEQVYMTSQLPHKRKENSSIYPHFHWTPSDNESGDVVWCIDYNWANINETFSEKDTKCVVDSTNSIENQHLMTKEIFINGTDKNSSAMLKSRLYRNATDSRDTYSSDAYMIEFDIHYFSDKLGGYDG